MPLLRKCRTRWTKPVSRWRAPSRPQQCPCRIGVRHDRAGGDLLAALELDAGDAVALERDALDRARRADRGAGRARGRRQRLADRAHAARRDREPVVARRLSAHAVQQREHGIVRARAEIRAEHGVEGERALERRRLEDLLEHVVDVDARDAQELAHVVAAEEPDAEAELRRAHQVGAIAAAEPRRLAVVLLGEDPREFQHPRVVVGEALAVRVRDRARLELAVLDHEVFAGLGERDGLEPRLRPLEPVRGELEVARDARIEEVGQVRAAGDLVALGELARDRGPADLGGGFEHDDFAPGACEVSRADEAVVAAADDDDAIAVSHPASPPARYSDGAGPSGSRARHSRRAPPSRRRPDACPSRTCRSPAPGRGTARSPGTAG